MHASVRGRYLCGNRYRVTGCLGEGGFGRVYLAEDQVLKCTWAIKEIGDSESISYAAVKAEISVLAKVSHPGIVRITDAFRSDGRIYIVMDHVKGMNLTEFMKKKKRLTSGVISRWSMELCDALNYLHHMDPPVILRDLKPQNIMVRHDGHLILVDFGAAITGAEGMSDTTPCFASRKYAAPEQLKEGYADARSDIYALGIILGLISGKEGPFGMSWIIKRCTMKDPHFRYRSTGSVKRDLILMDNTGRITVAAVIFLTAGCLMLAHARKDTEEINENARAEQAYEQSLMCFYELEDYSAAGTYLEEVPDEVYPEAAYYRELSEGMLEAGADGSILDTLERFAAFNEETIRPQDTRRYVKNLLCMAKAYIVSEGGAGGYEKACDTASKVLEETDVSEEDSADALCLMINAMILKGRSAKGDEVRRVSYHDAIECINKLTALPSVSSDSKAVTARLMDEAALYTELEEYDMAIKIYEEAEERYPGEQGIRYFAHLSLLLQTEASDEEIADLWNRIRLVEGIESDSNYAVMKERLEGSDLTSGTISTKMNNGHLLKTEV